MTSRHTYTGATATNKSITDLNTDLPNNWYGYQLTVIYLITEWNAG